MDATPPREGPVRIGAAADGSIRTLTLARPSKANALDPATVDGLHEVLRGAVADGVAVAFLGEGRAFSGGFDFSGIERESEGDLLLRFVRIEALLQAVHGAPVATFALVGGAAFGAGADLAAACACRIGSPEATFRFPGFRFGVALGTRRLAHLVGTEMARAILLENRTVGAEEALEIGLLDRIVERADLLAAAERSLALHRGLEREATARILRLTAPDTGDADMAELVRSLASPGLHQRIAAYRKPGT